jgi:uncharacterized protein YecT (DUF1311 family)
MPRIGLFAAVALAALASVAAAETQYPAAGEGDPEIRRRCQGVVSLVERTICDNSDLAVLDRDINRYLSILMRRDPARAGALEAGQHAFLAQRQRACGNLAAPGDYDGPAYRCLRLQLRMRLVHLAAQGGSGLSGFFRAQRPDMTGELAIVEWPDGRAQVMIDTLTPPDARTCSVQFTAQAGPALAGSPRGAPECRVGVDALGRTAMVRSDGDCRAVCVLDGRPDGVYRR